MTVFDPRNETMPLDLLEQFQLERLQAVLARLKRSVRRYRDRLEATHIERLADVSSLPFTTARDDLLDAFPYGMFALPLREVIRLQSTVGPDGRRMVTGHTRNDLDYLAKLVARQLVAASVDSHDIIQMSHGETLIGQSLGCMLGAELIEATVMPEDTFHIEHELETLRNCRATVLMTTPTHASDLMKLVQNEGMDPQSLPLRTIILTRPVSDQKREQLKDGLFADICCSFGVPELMDPGLCTECEHRRLHVNEDHFLVEVDDGELIATSLRREAMPLLRYRTGFACELERRPCKCGRTGIVLTPKGRKDERFYVNEIPLYPNQIKGVLAKTRAVGQPFDYRIEDRHISLAIEMSEQFFTDRMSAIQNPRADIEAEFMARLGIFVKVSFVAPNTLPREK